MDQRKRKRMISNRESARRSRMRKQKHLEDLTVQTGQLRKDNNDILTNVNITTQLYLNLEAENSILRAQMAELTQRLNSLNEILSFINSSTNDRVFESDEAHIGFNGFNNSWGNPNQFLNQPIMAAADLFMC